MEAKEHSQLFDQWMSAHKGLLFKVVRAYASSRHDQEDLFQEITIQLWNSIRNFNRHASETTWIYRVALYTAMGWSKKEKRHYDKRQSLNGQEHVPQAAEDDRVEWLYDQIRHFDAVDRSLTLLLLEGLSYKQMAATLGISVSNVGVKINRIKRHLATKSFKGK